LTTKEWVVDGRVRRFLNAFWNEHQGEAEKIWAWKHKCDELDLQAKDQGTPLSSRCCHHNLLQVS